MHLKIIPYLIIYLQKQGGRGKLERAMQTLSVGMKGGHTHAEVQRWKDIREETWWGM
jgi:hypothetical protein